MTGTGRETHNTVLVWLSNAVLAFLLGLHVGIAARLVAQPAIALCIDGVRDGFLGIHFYPLSILLSKCNGA